jgi:hypothetical protein
MAGKRKERVAVSMQDECSMPSNSLCYAVLQNLLKSFVLVFSEARGMEI